MSEAMQKLLPTEIHKSAATVVTIIIFYVIGLILRLIINKVVARLARRTAWKWDDAIIETLGKWIPAWSLLTGAYLSLSFWALTPEVEVVLSKLFIFIIGITVIVAITNLATKMIALYETVLSRTVPLTSLTQNMTRMSIIAIGALMLLNSLGISITPIITTLGIGGLAVALALQDTLSNLFAGFYTTVTRQVRVGDFVKLESGEEGYVLDIGWRATRVRMLPNNVVLIPNSKLAQSVITNYYFPEKELAILLQVGVHYESDLGHVEKITCAVGKEIMKEVQGGVPEFDPFIRYHTFSDFSINFTVILRAKEFVDGYLIKHEFIKRLHKRYAEEGINIPYPIRAINYSQEKAEK